jgi:hypothetical protein
MTHRDYSVHRRNLSIMHPEVCRRMVSVSPKMLDESFTNMVEQVAHLQNTFPLIHYYYESQNMYEINIMDITLEPCLRDEKRLAIHRNNIISAYKSLLV